MWLDSVRSIYGSIFVSSLIWLNFGIKQEYLMISLSVGGDFLRSTLTTNSTLPTFSERFSNVHPEHSQGYFSKVLKITFYKGSKIIFRDTFPDRPPRLEALSYPVESSSTVL